MKIPLKKQSAWTFLLRSHITIKFEINLIFLIKPFCYITKKSRQNILRTKRAFICQRLSKTWVARLINSSASKRKKSEVKSSETAIKRCSQEKVFWRRTPTPKCGFNKVAVQLYWNRTRAWVFSCKYAGYFQNTFLYEHLLDGCFCKILL